MPLKILSGFVPWIAFSLLYGSKFDSMLNSSFFAAVLVLIFNFKELKKGFILPVGTFLFFIILGIITEFHLFPWAKHHASLVMNLALAAIVWLSMLIKKPFTLQYARETVDRAYWNSPLFLKINWILTLIWAIVFTLIAIPSIVIPQAQYIDSGWWNYGLNLILIVIALYLNQRLPNFIIGRNFWQTVAKLPSLNSPFLQGGFKPVKEEVTLNFLEVEGTLPNDLYGKYLRNGPNPFFTPYTYTYPIDGDGMIHEINIQDGNVSYRNRFVKTKGLMAEQKAGKALYGGIKLPIMPDPKYVQDRPVKNTAAIHVIPWGNDLLALYEAAPAYVLGKELNTIGEWYPNGTQKFNVNAHHRIDPLTKHTYMCTYTVSDEPPYLYLYEFDQYKKLIKVIPIDTDKPTMIHDFVITKNYIIFFITPAIFNVGKKNKPNFAYEANQTVTIFLVDRKTYMVNAITGIASFFVFHFLNAYEEDKQIIIDFVHWNKLELNPGFNPTNLPLLYRGEINLTTMTYTHRQLAEYAVEFPSCNWHYTGIKHRYGYLTGGPSANGGHDFILKYDFQTNTSKVLNLGSQVEVGEVIFVPQLGASEEDQGYLVTFLYHKDTDKSDFILINAKDFNQITARVCLPIRVPHGLHGSWIYEKT